MTLSVLMATLSLRILQRPICTQFDREQIVRSAHHTISNWHFFLNVAYDRVSKSFPGTIAIAALVP